MQNIETYIFKEEIYREVNKKSTKKEFLKITQRSMQIFNCKLYYLL